MKLWKRILIVALVLCLCAGPLSGCRRKAGSDDGKLKVVVTIFPIYDWVRNLLGDRADDVELTLLEQSGADLHNFQPTIQDIYTITSCDLFICVGGESDQWVDDALAQADRKDLRAVKLLGELGSAAREEEDPEGSEEGNGHGDTEYDEHIWLSVRNAALLCPILADALAEADPAHADVYRGCCDEYVSRLNELDGAYAEAVEAAPGKNLLFADRYPFLYLIKDYGLTAYAAFSGCSAESEASFEMISSLVRRVDELNLRHILVLEGSDRRLASTIVSESRAKDAEILEIDSMQSVTMAQIRAGASYLDIMQRNLEVLRKALSD